MASTSTPITLRDLKPEQWRSGIAAWLGWFFDGMELHLFTVVAAPFVAELLNNADRTAEAVTRRAGWIQASFLIGWALGGALFGRLGDKLGRARTLSMTILTYALFTGLSVLAMRWWHLLIFRFIAALGIGGEWAVGASLLSETWPKNFRGWIAAVLQCGVNLGIMIAMGVWALLTALPHQLPYRYIFALGILPALIVYWIRKNVPEPAEWHAARETAGLEQPGIVDLFKRPVLWRTLPAVAVCAFSLTAWWAFMFWNSQHITNLPEMKNWAKADIVRLPTLTLLMVVGVSIPGNFFAGWLARRIGYRLAIVWMFVGFLASFGMAYGVKRELASLRFWIACIGFFSGVFGLFTMYLPPLFPTLLRTTGAGFCYNIGRVAAAAGTVFFGLFNKVGDFRLALLCDGLLLIPAIMAMLWMPDMRDEEAEPVRAEVSGEQ
ncbi:MAG: MFS transporter [Tepidisphaeraceae bacterium]